MPERIIDIPFPIGGLNRRMSFQDQPPATTLDALNVRPDSTPGQRTRGGTRPGAATIFPGGAVLSLKQINMLESVRAIPEAVLGSPVTWHDQFGDSSYLGSWDQAAFKFDVPVLSPPNFWPSANNQDEIITGIVADAAITNPQIVNYNEPWEVAIQIEPYANTYSAEYDIYVTGVNDGDAAQNLPQFPGNQGYPILGHVVRINLLGGELFGTTTVPFTVSFITMSGQSAVQVLQASGEDLFVDSGLLRMVVNPAVPVVNVFWRGAQIGTFNPSPFVFGGPVGFGIFNTMNPNFAPGFQAWISQFQFTRTLGSDAEAPSSIEGNFLVAATDGQIFQAATDDTDWTTVTFPPTDPSLNGTDLIQGAEARNRLYIGDYGVKAEGSGNLIDVDGQTVLEDLSADFVNAPVRGDEDMIALLPNPGLEENGYAPGVYAVGNLLSATQVEIIEYAGTIALGTISYIISRQTKVYNPSTRDLDVLQNRGAEAQKWGQPPLGCRLIGVYRDRLVLAHPVDNPATWFMSAQGTVVGGNEPAYPAGSPWENQSIYLDWNFADPNATVEPNQGLPAVAGINTRAGVLPQPITAIAPFTDDYLVMWSLGQTFVLRGDPFLGGTINTVSRTIGCIDKGAWCTGPAGDLWWMSRDGLYHLPPGANAYPQSQSREKLPDELINIDRRQFRTLLAFDVRDRGIHIYVTGLFTQQNIHWWYDLETASFWPMQFGSPDIDAFSVLTYESDSADQAAVVWGGRKGVVYRFWPGRAVDKTNLPFESRVLIGPMMLGQTGASDGIITDLDIDLSSEASDVTFELKGATTAQLVAEGTGESVSRTSDTISNNNGAFQCRTRGKAATLKLTSTGRWAVEDIVLTVKDAGRQRNL